MRRRVSFWQKLIRHIKWQKMDCFAASFRHRHGRLEWSRLQLAPGALLASIGEQAPVKRSLAAARTESEGLFKH